MIFLTKSAALRAAPRSTLAPCHPIFLCLALSRRSPWRAAKVSALARHLLVVVRTVGDQRQVVLCSDRPCTERAPITSEGQWRRGQCPCCCDIIPSRSSRTVTALTDSSSASSQIRLSRQGRGEPFFDHLARPLPRVMAIQRRLVQIANERLQINAAADGLHRLGALSAIDLPEVRGRQMYATIDISVLSAVPGPTLAKLTPRPQDLLQLAAALDVSAAFHARSRMPSTSEPAIPTEAQTSKSARSSTGCGKKRLPCR